MALIDLHCPNCFEAIQVSDTCYNIPEDKVPVIVCPLCSHRSRIAAFNRQHRKFLKKNRIEKLRVEQERLDEALRRQAEEKYDAWLKNEKIRLQFRDDRRQIRSAARSRFFHRVAGGVKQLTRQLFKSDSLTDGSGESSGSPVYCPECETKCSSRASACPHCGHPLTEPQRPLITVIGKPKWVIASILVGCLIVYFVYAARFNTPEVVINYVESPSSAMSESEQLNRAEMGLRLILMGNDFVEPHDKKVWMLATWMIQQGYRYSGSDKLPAPLDVRTVMLATSGIHTLNPQNTEPYLISWKLRRSNVGTRSYWCTLSFNVRKEFSYEVQYKFVEFHDAWHWQCPTTTDDRVKLMNFQEDFFELWKRDFHPEYYSNISKEKTDEWVTYQDFKVINRRREISYMERYDMKITQDIGIYRYTFEVHEEKAWANEPPRIYILFDIEHLPALDGE